MYTIDWFIIWIPILFVVACALRSQRYTRGVADFLSAGRVAGRYVVSVANGEAAFGLISAVALFEMYYRCGFAVSFWSTLTLPISMVLGLVGFCNYRFRETRALTMGQFFEMRYSRSLRVVAAVIQSISGIINYAIFPAVGARFLIYFLDLPIHLDLFGLSIPVFPLVMLVFLGTALYIALAGGQVTIMVTDCVQGLLSYPMYVLILGYVCYKFSWNNEMAPALEARPPEQSFLDAYDVSKLSDFNLVYVFSGLIGLFLNRMSWGGASGYNGAAKSAHEAKMGALLGTWRGGFNTMIFILLAVAAFAYLNHQNYAEEARAVRSQLAAKTLEDVVSAPQHAAIRDDLMKKVSEIPARSKFSAHYETEEAYLAEAKDPYVTLVQTELKNQISGEGAKMGQTFATVYNQMLVPVAIREYLPAGITGIFCALMIFLMVSTDTTYMHSWGSILVQDFVLPLRKRPFTPREQLRALRISIASVCAFAFLFSWLFAQIDFILMFFAITGAIWAGAGSVITFGLYWKRGTTQGAFTSLIFGAVFASTGIIAQKTWASHIYPAIERAGKVEAWEAVLQTMAKPFGTYVSWHMNPFKFPFTSVEVSLVATLSAIFLYIAVSLLTCKEPFNMDRLLHRGIYSDKGEVEVKPPFQLGVFLREKILGITPEYTTGDKILASSVFLYSFGYDFGLCFAAVIIWNLFQPWTTEAWSMFFFIRQLLVAGAIGIVTAFWFGICGTRDLLQLFRDLETKEVNDLDNGSVVGHVSAMDLARSQAAENRSQTKE